MTKKTEASTGDGKAAKAGGKVKAMLTAAKKKKKHRGSGGSKGPRGRGSDDGEVEGRELNEKVISEETKGKRAKARLADTSQKAINAHMAAAGRRTQGRRDSKGR